MFYQVQPRIHVPYAASFSSRDKTTLPDSCRPRSCISAVCTYTARRRETLCNDDENNIYNISYIKTPTLLKSCSNQKVSSLLGSPCNYYGTPILRQPYSLRPNYDLSNYVIADDLEWSFQLSETSPKSTNIVDRTWLMTGAWCGSEAGQNDFPEWNYCKNSTCILRPISFSNLENSGQFCGQR